MIGLSIYSSLMSSSYKNISLSLADNSTKYSDIYGNDVRKQVEVMYRFMTQFEVRNKLILRKSQGSEKGQLSDEARLSSDKTSSDNWLVGDISGI